MTSKFRARLSLTASSGWTPAVAMPPVWEGEVNLRRDNIGKMFAFYDNIPASLRAASDYVVITYANCFQGHGEEGATAWLLSLPRKEE